MIVLETPRLVLRRLNLDDAAFMLGLLNEPSFLANIGDKGVRTLEDARQFLLTGPMASYEKNGFGHYMVELKDSRAPIGTLRAHQSRVHRRGGRGLRVSACVLVERLCV